MLHLPRFAWHAQVATAAALFRCNTHPPNQPHTKHTNTTHTTYCTQVLGKMPNKTFNFKKRATQLAPISLPAGTTPQVCVATLGLHARCFAPALPDPACLQAPRRRCTRRTPLMLHVRCIAPVQPGQTHRTMVGGSSTKRSTEHSQSHRSLKLLNKHSQSHSPTGGAGARPAAAERLLQALPHDQGRPPRHGWVF